MKPDDGRCKRWGPMLPFEPLWRASKCETHGQFAAIVGATRNGIQQYYQRGLINWRHADNYAIALGFHPVEIWGDEWFAGVDLEEVA